MALAISELNRQQKKVILKHELEEMAKLSEEANENDHEHQDGKMKAESMAQLSAKNENKFSSATLASIENSSEKKPLRQSNFTAQLKSQSEKDLHHVESANSSHYQKIRKVDLLEEYEINQNKKFKPFFINNNHAQDYMNRKIQVFNHIRGAQENTAQVNKTAGQIDMDFLSALSPKGGTYEIQKRALNTKFKREFAKYAMTPKQSENSIHNTSMNTYYKLCKSLRIDKIMSDGKDQMSMLLDESDRSQVPERFQTLNPELSSVLRSLTKEVGEEVESAKLLPAERKKELNNVRLPPIIKEKNMHVEKAEKLIVKSAQPRQISPNRAIGLAKVLEVYGIHQ